MTVWEKATESEQARIKRENNIRYGMIWYRESKIK